VSARRSTVIESALLRKGFRVEQRHHRFLILYVDGRRTAIRTKISHGGKDYGDFLLSRMREQLRLPTVRQLLRLIDCPMDSDEYVTVLRACMKSVGGRHEWRPYTIGRDKSRPYVANDRKSPLRRGTIHRARV